MVTVNGVVIPSAEGWWTLAPQGKLRCSQKDLEELTAKYLKRAEGNTDSGRVGSEGPVLYPLDQVATWRIFPGGSGCPSMGGYNRNVRARDEQVPLVHGRFIDVVSLAVQLYGFYWDDTRREGFDPGDSGSGYIELAEILEIPKTPMGQRITRPGLETAVTEPLHA